MDALSEALSEWALRDSDARLHFSLYIRAKGADAEGYRIQYEAAKLKSDAAAQAVAKLAHSRAVAK